MRPVQVQVIAFAPTVFYHCQHCELTFRQVGFGRDIQREQARTSLPKDLLQDFRDLSVWVHSLHERYGNRVRVRVVDAASIEGFFKSLRYGVRRYPAVVVDGRRGYDWDDLSALSEGIERSVAEAATAGSARKRAEGGGAEA
jgi:hypothetical protein